MKNWKDIKIKKSKNLVVGQDSVRNIAIQEEKLLVDCIILSGSREKQTH